MHQIVLNVLCHSTSACSHGSEVNDVGQDHANLKCKFAWLLTPILPQMHELGATSKEQCRSVENSNSSGNGNVSV